MRWVRKCKAVTNVSPRVLPPCSTRIHLVVQKCPWILKLTAMLDIGMTCLAASPRSVQGTNGSIQVRGTTTRTDAPGQPHRGQQQHQQTTCSPPFTNTNTFSSKHVACTTWCALNVFCCRCRTRYTLYESQHLLQQNTLHAHQAAQQKHQSSDADEFPHCWMDALQVRALADVSATVAWDRCV